MKVAQRDALDQVRFYGKEMLGRSPTTLYPPLDLLIHGLPTKQRRERRGPAVVLDQASDGGCRFVAHAANGATT